MLRVAILESEEMVKNILFILGDILKDEDWTFQYFAKLSQFVKAQQQKEYQILILQDKFDTQRIAGIFIQPYPERVVIFTTLEEKRYEHEVGNFERILYIDRRRLRHEFQRIDPFVRNLLANQEEYFFSYNHISVPLKISDIYYIEKDNKNLVYHTKRGEFSERKSIKDAEKYFEKYHFLRIHSSFLVNLQYVTRFETESVFLQKIELPFARARRPEVIAKVRDFTKHT